MKIFPQLDDVLAQARPGAHLPIVAEMPLGDLTPTAIYSRIRHLGGGFILESGKHHRYSYVGLGSGWRWCSRGERCEVRDEDGTRTMEGDPFDLLRDEIAAWDLIPNPLLENFPSGVVGYFGYDMARRIERLPEIAAVDLDIPESFFLRAGMFCEIDHGAALLRIVNTLHIGDGSALEARYGRAVEEIGALAALLHGEPIAVPHLRREKDEGGDDTLRASLTPEGFAAIVRRAKEYIAAGDIFQVNLSVRFQRRLEADPFDLYLALREINPAPYMAFLDLPELAIVSASPELLLKVRGRTLETRPIAGTRPRGASREEDLANARELIENEKERAEHLMLVDLERNDIGRVARYGSVEVNEFMAIEEYSHVIHIVSNVRGELAEGRTTFDAIRACFPGGTITGAPKVRSMEIIEELEPSRRGIYTGSIGWIGENGDAELNIAIRTIVVKDGVAYAQAGAGIVADSVPELEYIESLRKAQAALEAMQNSEL
jgi:aminodeoxychorismate synthase component I